MRIRVREGRRERGGETWLRVEERSKGRAGEGDDEIEEKERGNAMVLGYMLRPKLLRGHFYTNPTWTLKSKHYLKLDCNPKPYIFKGEVHPEIKLVLIGVEKWEKQVSESLSKFRLKIRKLGFFKLWWIKHKLATLWRKMRAQLPFA